jgi:hypothetical protein
MVRAVPWAVAHSVVSPLSSTAYTSQRQTARLRPAWITQARACSSWPWAARRKSMVKPSVRMAGPSTVPAAKVLGRERLPGALEVEAIGGVHHLTPVVLRPTPPVASLCSDSASAGSGRQVDVGTTPGATMSSPSKKRAIWSGLRRWYELAELAL